MKRFAAVTTVVGSACLASCFIKPDRPGGAPSDSHTSDTPIGPCAGSVTWGAPRELTELGTIGSRRFSPWLSKDKSELWFSAVGASAEQQLWHTSWNGSAWGSATQIFDLGTFNVRPHFVVSDNGLDAWFTRMQGDDNIYTASRVHPSDPFVPGDLASFSVDGAMINEDDPALSGDGTIMVFSESMGGGGLPGDLMITTRASVTDPWATPVALSQYNTAFDECCEALSEDGNTLLFSSNKTNDYTIYIATRANNQASFGGASALPRQISGHDNYDPVLSRDGLTIVFASDAGGGSDRLWQMDGSCAQ